MLGRRANRLKVAGGSLIISNIAAQPRGFGPGPPPCVTCSLDEVFLADVDTRASSTRCEDQARGARCALPNRDTRATRTAAVRARVARCPEVVTAFCGTVGGNPNVSSRP